MAPAGTLRVAVSGSASDALERVARQLMDSGLAEVVRWDGSAQPDPDQVDAVILVSPEPGAGHAPAVLDRAKQTPVVAVGGTPLSGVRCWLPDPPTPGLLEAVIKGFAPAASAAAPASADLGWRRKADMIVGTSTATRQLLRVLSQLAPSSAPVLVTGESGTGKELVANTLHYCGPRRNAPFIAINCAAIPEQLFEAELFGYQRGAFTGAIAPRAGAFEAAHQGTLFLDEIGEMPRALQAKLLRALETSEITRLGSTSSRAVDVRVVAATNRKLEDEVAAGRFREDLYYRLRVYPVHLVPLRERPDDVPAIVQHQLGLIAARERRTAPRLTPAALEKLLSHDWPGNVRELVNVLQRACLLSEWHVIDAAHVALPNPSSAAPSAASVHAYRDAKAQFESEYYSRLLTAAGGNISLAAKLAQKTRKEIYDALKRVGLEPTAFRRDASQGEGPEE